MPIITKITLIEGQASQYRVTIEDDGKLTQLNCVEDVLIKFSLRKGLEIDVRTLLAITEDNLRTKAFHKALNYLSYRMRSTKEMRDHLISKEIPLSFVNDVIKRLLQEGYLNDKEFAIAYVRTQKNAKKGPLVIRLELKEKGIEESIITLSLQEYSSDEQIETVKLLVQKEFKKNKSVSLKQKIMHIQQFLYRKGFSREVIQIGMSDVELDKEENVDEEWNALITQARKLERKYKDDKFKLKQALYRKGFELSLIEKYLSDKEEE